MKKILGIVAVLIVIAGGWFGYKYWHETYQSQTAYAKVGEAVKKNSKTSDGKNYKVNGKQYYYYEYEFDFVLKDGTTRHLGFDSAESANPTPLAPGSYVTAEISQKCVVKGPNPISLGNIPSAVQAKLK